MGMKKFITALTLLAIFLLGGCNSNTSDESVSTSHKPSEVFTTTSSMVISIPKETSTSKTLSKPIYAETREEIIIGVLNSFGGHDPDTFKYYPSDNGNYNKMYESFRNLLPEGMDYRDERTFEDFDTYEITGSDMDRSRYCCYLRGCTDAGVYIMIRYNYEKEMYYAQNISTSVEEYETAVENYKLVDLTKGE